MDIIEILKLRGLVFDNHRIKMVRHMDNRDARNKVFDLYDKGFFEVYQSYQSKPIFRGCDEIISFLGLDKCRAVFVGIYRVGEEELAVNTMLPPDFPNQEFNHSGYFYHLFKLPGYDDLLDRVVIDWGKAAKAWHQFATPKEIVEIYPKGRLRYFKGYLEETLTYNELVHLINCPEANPDWHQRLKTVAGVYLITDLHSGLQYIGSAYGKDGIWGRWSVYAMHPHGNNVKLIDLLQKEPGRERDFEFSILHVLPVYLNSREVIAWEQRYKDKLGTNAFGLNVN